MEDSGTGSRVTTYAHDAFGRVLLETRPTAPHAFHKYDNLGRRLATGLFSSTGGITVGSDDPTTENPGPVTGMMVNYSVPEVEEATKVFDALADGGEVRLQIGPTAWSPAFGMCVDRFGTPWMVSADSPQSG